MKYNLNNKILEAVNRGIKFALDDFEDNELQGQTNSKVKYKGGMNEYIDLMNKVVDLGLPSGTLWCKYNLDINPNQLAKAEDWYGGYYAWGELEANKTKKRKIYFNWNNYKFGKGWDKLSKYCNVLKYGLNGFTDNLNELLPEDDAAYQNKKLHNFKFHIPTKEQCEELINYTNNYWIYNYDPDKTIHNSKDDKGIQGLNGRVFIGKNGNQMFIPAAGYCSGSNINSVGSYCSLWSLSLDLNTPDSAYNLYFSSFGISIYGGYRYYGFSVRPVINL